MRFIVVAFCMLACQTEKTAPADKAAKGAETKALTAEEFCKQEFEKRQKRIDEAAQALESIPKNNDWEKLSDKAREKLLKPARDNLAKLKSDRQLHWPDNWPTLAKEGDIFVHPSRRESADLYWVVSKSIDDDTALAFSPAIEKLRGVKVQRLVVIQGLAPKQSSQKPNKPLDLPGVWHRIDDIKIDGTTYFRIARWPGEMEAKKLWPKYLSEHELKQKDSR